MKNLITLSINPSYFCNFRCSFCYLSDEELSNRKIVDKELLFSRLAEVSSQRVIESIDLYGGEIALIKKEKMEELIQVIKFFFQGKINIITNLSVLNPTFLRDDIELSVSWDYFAREKHEQVLANMHSLKKDFHLLILASEELVSMTDDKLDDLVIILNSITHLKTVEIKPFSDNSHHSQHVTFLEHEEFIKKWIARKNDFTFEFINIKKIKSSLAKMYQSWSDDHLYITPDGHFSVLEFDDNNKEYFLKMHSFEEYEQWTFFEKKRVQANAFCGKCEFLGSCLSEHLQPVKDLTFSCNGFKNLLKWYQTNVP